MREDNRYPNEIPELDVNRLLAEENGDDDEDDDEEEEEGGVVALAELVVGGLSGDGEELLCGQKHRGSLSRIGRG